MSRIVFSIGIVVATILSSPAHGLAQKPSLKFGESFEGEIPTGATPIDVRPQTKGMEKATKGMDKGAMRRAAAVTSEVPVTLKGGQNVTFQVTVVGSNRKVGLFLNDPAGKPVARSEQVLDKSNELTVEAGASGTYSIVVFSDRVGAFKLRVDLAAGEEDDAEALKAKIQRLKQELSEAEAKLEALEKKPEPKKPATKKRS